jgi:hypothetical protein
MIARRRARGYRASCASGSGENTDSAAADPLAAGSMLGSRRRVDRAAVLAVGEAARLLIWRSSCQAGNVKGWMAAGWVSSVEEAAVLAGARRAVRLIFAGWVPQDRVSS